jgi:putative cardiolipin synthase
VVDREIVGIGSFDVDPRSIALNTEGVIQVESPERAAQVMDYMDEGALPANSYRVVPEKDEDTDIERLV